LPLSRAGSACSLNPDPAFSISDIAIPIIAARAAAGLLGPAGLFPVGPKA